MFTGLCRDLNDAMLKAAFLGGTVIDEDEGVVWSREVMLSAGKGGE
jgi:hypothetical protein